MSQSFASLGEAIVLDVETTGFVAEKDRVIQLAMVEVDFSKAKDNPEMVLRGKRINTLLNPERSIPVSASRVNNIYDKNVEECPTFADMAHKFRDFIGPRPIVGHNILFDKRFLNAEFKRVGVKSLHRNNSYCTMRRFQDLMNDRQRKGSTLKDAADRMGIKYKRLHDALEDMRVATEVARMFYLYDSGLLSKEDLF